MLSYYNLTPGTYAKVKLTIFKQFSRFRFDFLIQYECEDLILIKGNLSFRSIYNWFFFLYSVNFQNQKKTQKLLIRIKDCLNFSLHFFFRSLIRNFKNL